MSTLLTNAYSALNLGDGLLVEESREVVRDAGFNPSAILALDPNSFSSLGLQLIGAELSQRRLALELGLGTLTLNEQPFERAFAVGGGYLRFPNRRIASKTYLSHITQFKILSQAAIPFGLLPVSIGPINCFKNEVMKSLSKAEFIAVRDDKSFLELKNLSNVYRIPDLSILHEIKSDSSTSENRGIGLILRNLDFPNWLRDVRRIIQIPKSFVMIQSSTGASNNDRKFIMKHFPELEIVTTREAFLNKRPLLVISSRLHGAIMSINEGIPAIHLGYERKSFGVYKDLGLSEFCLPADNLDFNLLEEKILRFKSDFKYSEYYFECISSTNDARLKFRSSLIGLISCLN